MTSTNQSQSRINQQDNTSSNISNASPKSSTTATMMETYRVGSSGAVKRIGTPNEHDVLSGRGGAINSHLGNQRFRDWVKERKNRYNLARTKAEKAHVATEVIDLVRGQNPPGRFLQRDQSSVTGGTTWWVEVDEMKAMAKTSQALREGAPSIRAAHKDDIKEVKKRNRRSSKKSGTSAPKSSGGKRSHHTMQQQAIAMPAPAAMLEPAATPALAVNGPMPPLEMSKSQAIEQLKANVEAAKKSEPSSTNASIEVAKNLEPSLFSSSTEADTNPKPYPSFSPSAPSYTPVAPSSMFTHKGNVNVVSGRHVKRSRLSENLYLPSTMPQPHIVKPDDETPPLEPTPSPIPLSAIPELGGDTFPIPAVPKRQTSLHRANSLALSDIGSGSDAWGDVEFVNPFDGDCDDVATTNNTTGPPPMPPFSEQRVSSNNSGARSGRNSIGNSSVKSLASDLSDLVDTNAISSAPVAESDFGEGMKAVYDAVHPGLTSPGKDEPIPTHLYPYRGSVDLRRSDSHSSPQLIC